MNMLPINAEVARRNRWADRQRAKQNGRKEKKENAALGIATTVDPVTARSNRPTMQSPLELLYPTDPVIERGQLG